MKAALYGKSEVGSKVYHYLKNVKGVNLEAVCTDSVTVSENEELVFAEAVCSTNDIPVISIGELTELWKQKVLDTVVIATGNEVLDFCVKRLKARGINNVTVVPSYYETYTISDESFIWIDIDKPRLPYLEYHIAFHCNLKCAGCTHFSNIIPEARFGTFDRFCNDLMRLQDMFWGIGKIRLLGGEPLLNPELPQFIYAARTAFADADIRVVSNGILIKENMKELFTAMRESSTYFDISMYPPTMGVIDKIADICNSNGVLLTVTSPIEEFMAGMNLHGMTDPKVAYDSCPASHCTYLCDGKISVCSTPQLIGIYNERYNTNIHPGDKDIIDLYDPNLNGQSLLDKLRRPMDICRYCESTRRTYKWHVSTDPDKQEWLVRA